MRRILALIGVLFAMSTTDALANNPKVLFKTNHGEFTVELYADKAPKTVANFLTYVKEGHYTGTIFHRVISDFMIQGGGFTADMEQKKVHGSIENEADNGLKNVIGTLAMARTNDPHSATAQFFINTANNDFLDFREKTARAWGYAVFGRVIEGMKTVNDIRAVKTGRHGQHSDVPKEAVIIESATQF
jgi:peptidyl-prolyl cis-trans isomerase B (cyclophilin B)